MSQRTQKSVVSINDWQVADLRLTAFPELPVKAKEIEWWQSTVGESPESRTFRPKSGELSEQGPFETGMLSLNIQQLRIDWHLTKARPQEIAEDDLLTVGGFSDVLPSFHSLMQKWLENDCPKLRRIAFGSVLLLPVERRQEGYEQLSVYLPHIELDPEGSSDFMYQINRPRNSNLGIPNLQINRLCKWSVSAFVNILMKLDQRTRSSEQYYTPEVYACRLELDISTTADFKGLLPQNKLVSVYEELVTFGKEILEKGDIP